MNKDELRAHIAEILKENSEPLMPAVLAERLDSSEREILQALPDEMRAFAPASSFDEIWTELTSWAAATLIVQHMGCVFEIKGPLNPGRHGHGYFNLSGSAPLGGHLKADEVDGICFLSLPFMGRESHAVQFIHNSGRVMFSVYVGRENHRLIPAARESFLTLKQRFSTQGQDSLPTS